MNTMKKMIGIVVAGALLLPFGVTVFAENGQGSVGSTAFSANTQIENPLKYDTFAEFAAAVIETAVKVLMPFIVLAFIYSGFLFVKAQGNEKELAEAKTAIWYSVIGAFILLGSWGFAQIIGETVSTIVQ